MRRTSRHQRPPIETIKKTAVPGRFAAFLRTTVSPAGNNATATKYKNTKDFIIGMAGLAEAVGLSPWHLQRLFKKAMGLSPRDYADARRSRRFRDELKDGESIAGATYGAGYGSSSRVYERAKTKLGMTPASYAKGGKGARISFTIVGSPLGRLLLAATAKGVCFVALGDDDHGVPLLFVTLLDLLLHVPQDDENAGQADFLASQARRPQRGIDSLESRRLDRGPRSYQNGIQKCSLEK